jgi:FAD binding domain
MHIHFSHLDPAMLRERLPEAFDQGRIFANVDILREPIPVVPTMHYCMGGIPTNYHGEVLTLKDGNPDTVVPGLMALGEAACVSVHGANAELGGCCDGERQDRLPASPCQNANQRRTVLPTGGAGSLKSMAAGSPLVGIWEDVPWLILALLPPFGGPGLELGGRGLLPHSQPLFILALLLFWRLGALVWSAFHGMSSHGYWSADASFALSNRRSS